jgi:prophage regulatory protein
MPSSGPKRKRSSGPKRKRAPRPLTGPLIGPRILRLPDVQAKVGQPVSTIYAAMAKGTFPQPIPLGERAVGWLESEIDGWILACLRKREAQGHRFVKKNGFSDVQGLQAEEQDRGGVRAPQDRNAGEPSIPGADPKRPSRARPT